MAVRTLHRSTADTRFTRLERVVLDALAQDLAGQVPDLAAQFAAARPTLRRNSGFGLFTEVSSPSPSWGGTAAQPPGWGPSVQSHATGDLGTVHVMIAGLRDPVAFTARLRDGRLLGIMGDSYGQDTRAIDFATVPFDQVFTLDPSGRSIPFAGAQPPAPPPVTRRAPPEIRAQTPNPHAAVTRKPPIQRQAASPDTGSLQHHPAAPVAAQVQAALRAAVRPASLPDAPASTAPDRVSLLIGAWAVLAVAAVLAVLVLDVPWPFALFPAIWLGASLRRPKVFNALQRAVQAWNTARAAPRA